MESETDIALKRAKKEEKKHIPTLKELKEEDKEFKKEEKEAFRLLKKKPTSSKNC